MILIAKTSKMPWRGRRGDQYYALTKQGGITPALFFDTFDYLFTNQRETNYPPDQLAKY